jgi:K+-transporting ATPase KdpF subunit
MRYSSFVPSCRANILHDFYALGAKFCRVFAGTALVCEDGFRLRRSDRRFLAAVARFGGRVRSFGEEEVTWAYVLSGLTSLALLVYLVAALIRAEDL